MARIKQESVEQVKAAADMLDVVGARTQLKKAGVRYTGRCPFHEERTPSFSVNPVDKLFYCFGCGKGGDLISFVRETESLDFAGAIEWLGERFRVPLEYEETSPTADAARKRRERLFAVLEQSTAFYERYLWETAEGEPVRAYLAGRGLGEDICREFRLGLSPVSPALARKAAEKGFTRAELAAAGLANRRGNDYFGGRPMFPLADARGRVVGYSARKLREDDPLQAKYVNSPEGELFHKSSVLYGLHLARQAIAKEERAIVVEGNTDAIALRQAGLEPVVASMGTALTERHLAELKRLTRRVYLCFDADAAGQAATLRGMDLAAAQGFEVKVVPLEPGLDPADAANSFGDLLGRAESYVFYRVRIELERAADRQEAFVRVREVLAGFEDSPERQDALRLVADRLDLPPETQAGLAPTGASATTGTVSSKVLDAGGGSSGTFSPAASHIPGSCPPSPRSPRSTSMTSGTARSTRISSPARSWGRSSCRCWPSSTPWPRVRRSRRRRRRSSCIGCVSVIFVGSLPRIPCGPTSSKRWNESARLSAASSRRLQCPGSGSP